MSSSPPWQLLEDRGFLVIRQFLSEEHIAVLLQGFQSGSPPESYPFGFKLIGRTALKNVWSRIQPVLAEIRACTSIKADSVSFLTFSHYITTRHAERSSFFHQDFDVDYTLTRDHWNYLNFWMPLRKPERSRSNVTLVPFDALRDRSPADYRWLLGSGGHRFIPQDGTTAVFGAYGKILSDGDTKTPERILSLNIEEIAVTPPLEVGDLLLMRGDLIHRTQDIETERIAASVRATYSGKVVTVQPAGTNAAPGGKEAEQLQAMLEKAFTALGRSTITIGELVEHATGERP